MLKTMLRSRLVGQQFGSPLGLARSGALILSGHTSRCYKHKLNTVRTFLSDKDRVQDFISLLNTEEKRILLQELKEHPELIDLEPTAKEEDTTRNYTAPNFGDLRALSIHQSLPFIGFGFLDNLIMILAGDYIDLTLGITLGISTMAAAGLGNALSDVAGVGSAYYVERLSDRIGVRNPKLSLVQLQMTRTRFAIQFGRAVGVTIGCIIGMFPLLFIPHKEGLKHDETET